MKHFLKPKMNRVQGVSEHKIHVRSAPNDTDATHNHGDLVYSA